MVSRPAIADCLASGVFDVDFSVPFTHRLRFTADVAGEDFDQLRGVLQTDASSGHPGKTLLWVDRGVQEASDVAARLSDRLSTDCAAPLVGQPLVVDGGENVKNSEPDLRRMLDEINLHDLDRRSYIVAVGGGAMLDACGFAAAIAHRGIRLIRLPTTTLAQADSGVGVKNAINYFGKKNWVGTFAVPWAVINDSACLTSLPDRDFVSGFTEAVKVALLKDEATFRSLVQDADDIRQRNPEKSTTAIRRACLWHLRHITEGGDPFEMLEARPLDFGHWSAHRLEPLSGYRLRHGEAVGIGVAIDCIYSSLKFGFPKSDVDDVLDALERLGVPLWDEAIDPIDRLMKGLEEFRQHLGGRLTITMLERVGQPINVHEIDEAAMREAILQLCQRS